MPEDGAQEQRNREGSIVEFSVKNLSGVTETSPTKVNNEEAEIAKELETNAKKTLEKNNTNDS